jgi:uncharacterized protein YjbI with pentapeptide repeats
VYNDLVIQNLYSFPTLEARRVLRHFGFAINIDVRGGIIMAGEKVFFTLCAIFIALVFLTGQSHALEASDLQKLKATNKCPGCDLSGGNLSNLNLAGADLTFANLTKANLSNSNLSNANLNRADLTDANLSRTNLTRANLNRADLSDTDLTDAILTDAILADAILDDTLLGGALWIDSKKCKGNSKGKCKK